MSTEKKIAANRANAEKSTGPRTAEGKMISALNARRHGLSSKSLYVPDGRLAEFEALKACYWAETQPVGFIQQEIFNQLVHAAWNLEIARGLLAEAFAASDFTQTDRLHRYINQHERSFHRALKALRTIQTDRAIRQIPEHQHLENLPDTVDPERLIGQLQASAKRTHSPTTFVDPFHPPSPPPAPAQAN